MPKARDEGVAELGFGLMRLPERDNHIDINRMCALVDLYLGSGFDYFDTAYIYNAGESEKAVREAISQRWPREAFRLATKLPAKALTSLKDRDKIFDIQRVRTGLEYFDRYLLHGVSDGANFSACMKYDCFEWGLKKRQQGSVRSFGFSFHGTPELLIEILDRYPDVDFVQVQINYADWDSPVVQSKRIYEILVKRNIPIIVMEPVKGGTLARLGESYTEQLNNLRQGVSAASWALRFVASFKGIKTVLSGMNDEAQLKDNLSTFLNFQPLSEYERSVLFQIADKMHGSPEIQCTGCRYCCAGCPIGIRIPDVFRVMNALCMCPGDSRSRQFYEGFVNNSGKAKECIACGQCEASCPQHLPVVKLMAEAARVLDKE